MKLLRNLFPFAFATPASLMGVFDRAAIKFEAIAAKETKKAIAASNKAGQIEDKAEETYVNGLSEASAAFEAAVAAAEDKRVLEYARAADLDVTWDDAVQRGDEATLAARKIREIF